MKKCLSFLLSLILISTSLTTLSYAHEPEGEQDYFTLHMHEILFELGCIDEVTGINDDISKEGIKAFQKKAEIRVDGLIGEETFEQLVLKKVRCDDNEISFTDSGDLSTSSSTTTTTTTVPSSSVSTSTPTLEKRYIVTGGNCSYSVVEIDQNDTRYESGMTLTKAEKTRDEFNTWRCVRPSTSTSTTTTTTTVPPPAGYVTTFDNSNIKGISVDNSRNAYITGSFANTKDFGGGSVSSSGSTDVYVVKLDSDGNYQWEYTAGGSSGEQAQEITTDSSGNSYITGDFQGTANFGGQDVSSAGGSDIFVVKLDSDGNYQWEYTAGGTVVGNSSSLKFDGGRDIDVDSSGNVYITGNFDTVVDFGGGAVSSSGKDIFVVKLDSYGNFQWVYNVLSTGDDLARSITTDSSGNSYITGYFTNTADFGGGDITSNGGQDLYVVKLDSDGNYQWEYTAGGTGAEDSFSITSDSSGNILTTGYFSNTVDFGGGDESSSDSRSAHVLKLDSTGSFDWVQTYSGTGFQIGYGIAADSSDNVFTTGSFYNTVDFGGGDVTSTGEDDIYLLKLNSSGSLQWIKTYGSTAGSTFYADSPNDLTVDSDGSVYTVGFTGEDIDFGTGNIEGSSYDGFVLKLTSSGSIE